MDSQTMPSSAVRLTVNWRPVELETDHDQIFLDRVRGFDEPLAKLRQAVPDANTGIAGGERGKGASAVAVATWLEISERVLNDVASLIEVGLALKLFIEAVSPSRGRPVLIDSRGLAALAAARAADELAKGAYYSRTVPLTTSGEAGTDERDVWAVCFDQPDLGRAYVVFMSPSGLVLGALAVPVEMVYDDEEWITRTEAQIDDWWSRQE